MLHKKIIFIVLILFGSQVAYSQFVPLKDKIAFLKGIESMAASTQTIKADFTQEKYLNILANKIDSKGKILFKKPNLLRWEYNQPFAYVIILNGKEIIIKDGGNTNSFDIGSSQAFKQINELIINSVQGNVLDEERFEITYKESDRQFLTELIPKEEQLKKFLKGIDIYFSKTDYSVTQVKLIEPEDDYTLISFQNQKMNEPVSNENFSNK